jgi:crotonobetainyl-CoA:carnitine CoA-transferase CaiB-like acyl-CoA transferase
MKGLKIIDISTVLAGPSVGMFFAELGSDVLKIEHPIHRDVTRTWKIAGENKDSEVSSYFSSVNYKKRYLQLDLLQAEDYATFCKLVQEADVLLSNFKSSDYSKFSITKKDLEKINPRLIHGRISGFGKDSDRVAYDLILQAESGLMSINGTLESGPVKLPVAMIDVLAAHQLKEGILVALLERMQTGRGKDVHVSLYHAAVCSLINQSSSYLMTGKVPKRLGSLHPSIAPYGEVFSTKDGELITFAIGSDVQFEKLMRKLELSDDILSDIKFSSNANRVENRTELFEKMKNKVQLFSSEELLTFSQSNHIPCGKIQTIQQVFEAKEIQDLVREEHIEGVATKRVTSIAFELE